MVGNFGLIARLLHEYLKQPERRIVRTCRTGVLRVVGPKPSKLVQQCLLSYSTITQWWPALYEPPLFMVKLPSPIKSLKSDSNSTKRGNVIA